MSIITINDIRPDGSGKYSDRLYRWCRKELKKPGLKWQKDEWEYQLPRAFLVGNYEPISVAKHSNYSDRNHTIWIGHRDADSPEWLYGYWAARIANPIMAAKKFESYALPSRKIEDVTEWFWSHYLDMGACFIIGDLKHDWIKINRNSRKCRHCLKHERRHVKTIRTLERVERWETDQ